MRTTAQLEAAARIYGSGGSKKDAMLAAGYAPRSAGSNVCKVFPRGSLRHLLFAHGLFRFAWNRTKAAVYAGYAPKWAATNTTRLMRHPAVVAEVERLRRYLRGEEAGTLLPSPEACPEARWATETVRPEEPDPEVVAETAQAWLRHSTKSTNPD